MMTAHILLIATALFAGGCSSLPTNSPVEQVATIEARYIHFAEQTIIKEIAKAKSFMLREAQEKCINGENVEIVLGVLGVDKSDIASDAFVRLFGVQLDGGGGEEFGCLIALRGSALYERLTRMDAKQVAESCRLSFQELRMQELANVTDVSVEKICRSEKEIQHNKEKWLKAIESGVTCEDY
jgi:hypothetical protein